MEGVRGKSRASGYQCPGSQVVVLEGLVVVIPVLLKGKSPPILNPVGDCSKHIAFISIDKYHRAGEAVLHEWGFDGDRVSSIRAGYQLTPAAKSG